MQSTIKIFVYTDIKPDHKDIAPDGFRNMGAPRRLYSPNITISAKRKTLKESYGAIREFFLFGGFDPDLINANKITIQHKGGIRVWQR